MSDFDKIRRTVRRFTEERNWDQFHSPKNLAMALSGEAGELVSIFQWMTEEESKELNPIKLSEAADEIADVQLYLIALADKLDIDIGQAVERKMVKNAIKYPPRAFYGSARKYNESDET
ncbi:MULTISPECIES: nucleotide pyrophosphohydrolase [unclassified Pigmentiphaga]|uniref:nucleotide pyrophosphohydrolase n=1 Tax=unclassified Pigmentiphaga TaxID=2626614 RepID=UPI0020CC7869|nr:nucleotide pyrophosphohydrolase [Pigmentiphaga sp. NML030171]